jgi:hypothetical protein
LKAITIRQPWASLIAAGIKDVENRTQNWRYRGRLAIHASQSVDRGAGADPRVLAATHPELRPWLTHRGHIVAVATLTDCHPAHEGCCGSTWGNHAPRTFHLVLGDIIRLERPVYASGFLGLWDLPIGPLAGVVQQLGATR